MDSPVASPISDPAFIAALPGWTLPRGHEPDALAVATTAGIALKALDDTSTPLHSTPRPSGAAAGAPGRP